MTPDTQARIEALEDRVVAAEAVIIKLVDAVHNIAASDGEQVRLNREMLEFARSVARVLEARGA